MRPIAALALALALAVPTLALAEDEAAAEEKVHSPASDFTLQSMSGENVSLSDLMGDQVVVLSFMATWCGPCLKEMPKLVELQEEFGDKVKVLWISVDDAKDEAKLGAIVKRFKLPPDQMLKDFERKVVSAYHKRGVPPYTVVIDKNKLKVLEKLGYTEGDEKKIHEKVTASL
jgi:thiol-disulfide isomerase/thioredoxin